MSPSAVDIKAPGRSGFALFAFSFRPFFLLAGALTLVLLRPILIRPRADGRPG